MPKHKNVKLPGGYLLEVEKQGIRIGRTIIDLGHPPFRKDIDAVKSVFAMGAAANASHVANAFNILIQAVQNPVRIIEGSPEEEE